MNPVTMKEMNCLMVSNMEGALNQEKKSLPELSVPEPVVKKRPTVQALIPQVIAALAVSLGSVVVGFNSAYTAPALVSMNRPGSTLHLTTQDESWIGSLLPLAALVGGALGGPMIGIFGRKTTLLSTAVPFTVSFMLIALASSVSMVMIGRAIAGFCVGVTSLALPVYMGETLQPEVRGSLGLMPTVLGNGGILICFLAGKYLNWSQLALFGASLPIPFLCLMFVIPETPRWYISKNKTKKAQQALKWLRGKSVDVSKELSELETTAEDGGAEKSPKMSELLVKKYMWPLGISIGLMLAQQLSGINAVIFYTVKIFEDAGSTIDSNLSAIIVGIVNFLSTFIASTLIDRLGRKVLLYTSSISMISTLFILGSFFYFKNSGSDISSYGWVPLASFVVYIFGFSIGFGPIPWLMLGEILPVKVRGPAASVATALNWTCTFIVTKTFADLTELLGSHGVFWLFGVICVIGLIFVTTLVPETKGKSLEDIEKYFATSTVPPITRDDSFTKATPLTAQIV